VDRWTKCAGIQSNEVQNVETIRDMAYIQQPRYYLLKYAIKLSLIFIFSFRFTRICLYTRFTTEISVKSTVMNSFKDN
jgi:hypothetical protein